MTQPDITVLLKRVARDEDAAEELMGVVYGELRRLGAAKMAGERPGHTLQPTALVHEAWMRLVDADGRAQFENRAHFFSAAAEAMRRILVDRARARGRVKRGVGAEHLELEGVEIAAPPEKTEELLAVDAALEKLAMHDARKAEVVKLRYFAGLSFEETAAVLGASLPTVNRDWAYARAWLHQEILRER